MVFTVSLTAQTNDPVVMKVNGKDIKKSEFEYIYNKNNSEESIEKITIKDYAELFKNFKLKVADAESQRLDTTAAFSSDLAEYRAQLVKPYLDEIEIDEDYVKKEYDRMKELVEISHILIYFPNIKDKNPAVFPTDTLETFKKAEQLRARLLKGEKYEKIAAEFSDDTRSKSGAVPGYLGWFPGLSLNQPLEDAAFNTPVGKIGLARTGYGYHIVKVHGRKPNAGQISAAHILITCAKDADTVAVEDATKKINEIYQDLKNGKDFAELAKQFSNDPGSAEKGGDLGWFGYGQMIKEFQDEAFALKEPGDMSKPFRTAFGFHIIKLTDKKPFESLEEKKPEIEAQINNVYPVTLHQTGFEKMKKEFGFAKVEAGYNKLLTAANTSYPGDSLFIDAFADDKDPLFKIDNEVYTIADFITYFNKKQRSPYALSTEYISERIQSYEYNILLSFKDKTLESKNTELRNLIQEYRDFILMFEISNREVWDKASKDKEGLEAYFQSHKDKYAWSEPYYKGYVVLVKDAKTKKKMQKEISKKSPDEAVEYLLENYKVGDVSYVKAEKGLFKSGDNAFVDESIFKIGTAEKTEEFQDYFLLGKKLTAPETHEDVRGNVVTDYQDYLEQEWLKKLNEKYQVTIFEDVLNTIK
ncbi:peptidylprolyl isomerase [Bacteroidia bacterium]|nr:peptidylprolyl isomerase [Bacteroidia bacterium]GHV07496.1 peptidylprolyl isomerase [Bacteroidia bacterium]